MELVICVFLIGFKNILVSYTEGRQVNVRDLPARAQAARSRESRPHLPPARRTRTPSLALRRPHGQAGATRAPRSSAHPS